MESQSTIVSAAWRERMQWVNHGVLVQGAIIVLANVDKLLTPKKTVHYLTDIDWLSNVDAELSYKIMKPMDTRTWNPGPNGWRWVSTIRPRAAKISINQTVKDLAPREVYILKITPAL